MDPKMVEEIGQHLCSCRLLLRPQEPEQQQAASDDDGAIGYVEGGPVAVRCRNQEEVGNSAADKLVRTH